MSAVVVDASVWLAAQDAGDRYSALSRDFFAHAVTTGTMIHVPAYARVEIACALARRLRSAAQGQRLSQLVLTAANATEQPVNAALLAKALTSGTARFLRGADALYAATADTTACELVSWDREHVQRAGAMTPGQWLAANR